MSHTSENRLSSYGVHASVVPAPHDFPTTLPCVETEETREAAVTPGSQRLA